MGTSVYLNWNKINEEEKEAQITGYSITDGDKGYLRASIGMVRENQVLREIFPNHWNGEDEDGKPFDFNQENYEKLQILGAKYLASILFDLSLASEDSEAMNYAKFGERISRMFQEMGMTQESFSRNLGIRSAVMWLNSLFDFFVLGMKKQEEKLEPKIYISW